MAPACGPYATAAARAAPPCRCRCGCWASTAGVATVRAALHVGDLLVQRPAGLTKDTPVRVVPDDTQVKGGDA